MKKLSILVCSLNSRDHFLQRLVKRVNPQLTDEVEFLVNVDDGNKSIGQKRNELVNGSTGQYVCFVDDDDLVAEDYVSRILTAIRSEPDCVGIEGVITFDGKNKKKFIHSVRYREWFERRGIYYRCCNHLNPVKRELALKVPFPEKNSGEDHDYSMQMIQHLHNEVFLQGPMYFYEFRSSK